jgi:hypothetical protein
MIAGVADPQTDRAPRLRLMIAMVAAAKSKPNAELTSGEGAPPKLALPPPELKLESE